MNPRRDIFRRDVISWALYDFANTIYSMNILSLYFAGWLVIDLGFKDIHYSLAFSISMLASAIIMPALGYFSDRKSIKSVGNHRLFSQPKLLLLFIFTVGAILSVIIFTALPIAAIALILFFFALSNFFFEGGIVFYNALLESVSTPQNVGKVSGFGVAMGYAGSVVGMILVLPFVTGGIFGLDIPFIEGGGKSGAFLPTAIYFGIFALPIFLFVREKSPIDIKKPFNGTQTYEEDTGSESNDIRQMTEKTVGIGAAYRDVWRSLKSTEKYPGLLRFLISDYFFEDAIATVIIFMAVFTERVLGLGDSERTLFFIISTVFAMLGAYLLGFMADRFSPKKVLFGIVAGWILILLLFVVNSYPAVFWILGPIVGILLGGVWSVSRPLLMQLSPPEKLGEFFGLFSLSGRAAAICGPLLWGAVVYILSPDNAIGAAVSGFLGLNADAAAKLPYRFAVLSLAAMMAVGLFIFRKVPDRKAGR
jgi:UMF1 family MFS transporter